MKIETVVNDDLSLAYYYCENRKQLLSFAEKNEQFFGDFHIEKFKYGYALYLD